MAKKAEYHHGDLRNALLAAAEEELVDKGPEKFSLRGCAKRAGVSHAAPAHHFSDTEALLQALAARGFARLTDELQALQKTAPPDPRAQLIAAGVGYVHFGINNPQLFNLMFGGHAHQMKYEELQKNGEATFSVLVNSVAKVRGQAAFQTEEGWRDVTALWSLAHGYAQLASGNKMNYVTDRPFDEQRPYIEDMLLRIIDN
ncbi:MAG: TetR/AcrR family transcriptional regulator [Pseudomonadota bacterium]